MKHDFRAQSDAAAAERFHAWLESETTDGLRRSYGDAEATKGVVFLFVNRAYEAHMPQSLIAETFGRSVARAGYREQHEEPVFACFEMLAAIAEAVHSGA